VTDAVKVAVGSLVGVSEGVVVAVGVGVLVGVGVRVGVKVLVGVKLGVRVGSTATVGSSTISGCAGWQAAASKSSTTESRILRMPSLLCDIVCPLNAQCDKARLS